MEDNKEELKIALGRILLGKEGATEDLQKFCYCNIPNETLRFVYIAIRAISRKSFHVTKDAVLAYLRRETFTTPRDMIAYSNMIDCVVQEAALSELQNKGDVI